MLCCNQRPSICSCKAKITWEQAEHVIDARNVDLDELYMDPVDLLSDDDITAKRPDFETEVFTPTIVPQCQNCAFQFGPECLLLRSVLREMCLTDKTPGEIGKIEPCHLLTLKE